MFYDSCVALLFGVMALSVASMLFAFFGPIGDAWFRSPLIYALHFVCGAASVLGAVWICNEYNWETGRDVYHVFLVILGVFGFFGSLIAYHKLRLGGF